MFPLTGVRLGRGPILSTGRRGLGGCCRKSVMDTAGGSGGYLTFLGSVYQVLCQPLPRLTFLTTCRLGVLQVKQQGLQRASDLPKAEPGPRPKFRGSCLLGFLLHPSSPPSVTLGQQTPPPSQGICGALLKAGFRTSLSQYPCHFNPPSSLTLKLPPKFS